MMNVQEITEKNAWENFQLAQDWPQFTQSWAWGEFRKSLGYPVKRIALTDAEGRWLVAVQGELRKKRIGSYWFAPRGPIFAPRIPVEEYRKLIEELFQQMYQKKLVPKALFWRVEPLINIRDGHRDLPARLIRIPDTNPSTTLLLDLKKSEADLQKEMHQKTRYNIRIAQKHGVKTRTSAHPADTAKFLDLMQETETRGGFKQHAGSYIAKTYQALAGSGMAILRIAEHENTMLAGNLEIRYGKTVTYLYGASSPLKRKTMAPYVLHWDAIRIAKEEGMQWYDFWGCNPPNPSSYWYKTNWEGITRFKVGWGGERRYLIGTWDLPIRLWAYYPLYLKRQFSRKKA